MNKSKKNISRLILAAYFSGIIFNPVLAQTAKLQPIQLRSGIEKASPSIDLKGGVKIDKYNRAINLSLRDSDLRQVIRMLADKAGQNIVLDDSVTGKVTLDLTHSTVNKAFEYLMTLNQLTYWQDGNTIVVATIERANKLGINKLKIKPIKVKYIDAIIVANFLNKNIFSLNKPGSSNAANTIVNPESNEVLIFGNDNDIALAQKVIDYVDVKPKAKTFNINYADIGKIGQLICDTIFSTQGSLTSSTAPTTTTQASGVSYAMCSSPLFESPTDLAALNVASYKIVSDPGLNQITIFGGTQEQIFQTENLIKKFDIKQPQVYIEVSIIELSAAGSKTLNNEWSYSKGKLNYTFAGGQNDIADYIHKGVAANAETNLTQTISMLIKESKGRVLANPRIIAANNKNSTVNISSQYIKSRKRESQQTTSATGDSATAIVTETYEYGDAGITLDITPKISPNGYVSLDLKPSYTTLGAPVTDSNNDLVGYLTNTRDLALAGVRVKDGETLIVAGLIQETDSTSTSKIPILAEIPFLGAFFKNMGREKNRNELILMITPKILNEDDDKTNTTL